MITEAEKSRLRDKTAAGQIRHAEYLRSLKSADKETGTAHISKTIEAARKQ